MNSKDNGLVDFIVTALEDKKAKDIKVLEVGDITLVADYFIVCSGTSTTHIKALADELEHRLETEKGILIHHKEGYSSARWILLDYSSIIINIFHQDDRTVYNLEKIWTDAKTLLEKK